MSRKDLFELLKIFPLSMVGSSRKQIGINIYIKPRVHLHHGLFIFSSLTAGHSSLYASASASAPDECHRYS